MSSTDYATILHNRFQAEMQHVPVNYFDTFEGPSNRAVWTSQCKINGVIYGTGKGSTKAEAKQRAAQKALELLEKGETPAPQSQDKDKVGTAAL